MSDLPPTIPLGKQTTYPDTYDASQLCPIPRVPNRVKIDLPSPLPFKGADIWNAYEISWLNQKGKPQVAIGELLVPCTTPNIVESKSLKLYLNSFNNDKLDSIEQLQHIMTEDLSGGFGAPIEIKLHVVDDYPPTKIETFSGQNIDHHDVVCDQYTITPENLYTDDFHATETIYSNLLKSNCLCTNQPDWGSVSISYTGKKINQEGLLKYIVSFRNINDFAEPCVERIFMDITRQCAPTSLLVYARYTRRGGLDINPYRASLNYNAALPKNLRLCRQ